MPDTGAIRVNLSGGDRRPWTGGAVTIRLVDPFSPQKLILARHRTKPGVSEVLFQDVPADRGQNYSLLANAKGRRDAGRFPVKPLVGQEIQVSLMLLPEDPVPDLTGFSYARLEAVSEEFHGALTRVGIGEDDFRALSPERIAGALNIEAKLRATPLAARPAIDFLARIGSPEDSGTDALRQDRILCWVDPAMAEAVRREIEQSDPKSFHELAEFENEIFHAGYPVSFKQRVPFASLQLSFAARPGDNNLLAADIDIDLYTDIGHFGEVLRNHLLRSRTDPYTVYRMLFDQGIEPLYTLPTVE